METMSRTSATRTLLSSVQAKMSFLGLGDGMIEADLVVMTTMMMMNPEP